MRFVIYEIIVLRLGLYGVLERHLEITYWILEGGLYLDIGKYL